MSKLLDKVREMDPVDRMVYYMNERYDIYQRRKKGFGRDVWTMDPIFRKYKFTNVRRKWDYTSKWLVKNWYRPMEQEENVGAGMSAAFARFFCFVPTFEAVGNPVDVNSTRPKPDIRAWLNEAHRILLRRQQQGHKVFTSAYVIGGVAAGQVKTTWVINEYLKPVLDSGILLEPWRRSIEDLHQELHKFNGWGDFMTQEVVLDLMDTFVLRDVKGKRLYGHAGPGAKRGLNRIASREARSPLSITAADAEMIELWHALRAHRKLNPELQRVLTVHDVEFSLCEYDKYCRVLFGEGTPKQLFKPRPSNHDLELPL